MNKVIEVLQDLTEDHGVNYFSVNVIAEMAGLPLEETKEILYRLHESNVNVIVQPYPPSDDITKVRSASLRIF